MNSRKQRKQDLILHLIGIREILKETLTAHQSLEAAGVIDD